MIGGFNFNTPVNIQTNGTAIKNALFPCAFGNCTLSPLQQLNQQFVAAQLSLSAVASGLSSISVLNARLGCYSVALANFQPVTLSNGVVISLNSTVGDLFSQAQSAIRENRTQDMVPLAQIFALIATCGTDGLGVKISLLDWNPADWEPDLFLLPRRIRVS